MLNTPVFLTLTQVFNKPKTTFFFLQQKKIQKKYTKKTIKIKTIKKFHDKK